MKKTTRIMMIAAVAVAGLSAIGLLISLLFQWNFVEAYGGNADAHYVMVPLGQVISCFGGFALALVMLFVVCNDRYPLKVDAICAGLLAVGVPLLTNTVHSAQIYVTSRLMEIDATIYLSHLISVCNFSQPFMGIVTALTLLACGMSIAVKYLNGKK